MEICSLCGVQAVNLWGTCWNCERNKNIAKQARLQEKQFKLQQRNALNNSYYEEDEYYEETHSSGEMPEWLLATIAFLIVGAVIIYFWFIILPVMLIFAIIGAFSNDNNKE